MNRSLRWRQAEDQPAASRIDVIEAEHVGKEGAIGVGVAAEEDEVRPEDHVHMLPLELLAAARQPMDGSIVEEWCTEAGPAVTAHHAGLPYDTMSVIRRRFVGT